MEREIRSERQRQVHARAEFKRKIADFIFVCIGSIVIIALLVGFIYILSLGG